MGWTNFIRIFEISAFCFDLQSSTSGTKSEASHKVNLKNVLNRYGMPRLPKTTRKIIDKHFFCGPTPLAADSLLSASGTNSQAKTVAQSSQQQARDRIPSCEAEGC